MFLSKRGRNLVNLQMDKALPGPDVAMQPGYILPAHQE